MDGLIRVTDYIDRRRDCVIAQGSFGALYAAYLEHARQWQALPGEPALSMMRQSLAAAMLHLALRPPDSFIAWTLNIREPALNFFITGDNSQFIVTGRVYTQDVKTAERSRLYVESHRPRLEPSRSSLDVDGLDVLRIFEGFYERSEQIYSRFFEIEKDDLILIQGLPQMDQTWLQSLQVDQVRAWVGEWREKIEERNYQFRCGCSPQRIRRVVQDLFAGKAEELFLGEPIVEVSCPRCGRRWWIAREDFDRSINQVGDS